MAASDRVEVDHADGCWKTREERIVRQRYDLHGLLVDVSGDAQAGFEWAGAVLAHVGLRPTEQTQELASVALAFTTQPLSIPAQVREVARQDGLRVLSGTDQLFMCGADHTLCLELAAGVGTCRLPETPEALRKDVLLYGLSVLLRRRGSFVLHASGAAIGDAGILLVGHSGSGKSTHTYSLIRRGWSYLGDDAILLRPRGDRTRGVHVEALSLRRELCLDPALAACFPDGLAFGAGSSLTDRGKRRLDPCSLYPDRWTARCMPRVLIFPEIVPAPESRLLPLEKPTALFQLIQQSIIFGLDPEMMPIHLDVLRCLVNQTKSYRLLAGRDLKHDPERVERLLSPLHSSAALSSVHCYGSSTPDSLRATG